MDPEIAADLGLKVVKKAQPRPPNAPIRIVPESAWGRSKRNIQVAADEATTRTRKKNVRLITPFSVIGSATSPGWTELKGPLLRTGLLLTGVLLGIKSKD